MEALSVFLQQVEALNRDLDLALRSLESESIRADLRERILHLFANEIKQKKRAVAALEAKLEKDGDLPQCWDHFQELQEDCEPILHELLAFLEGALVRTACLDDQICDIADALLYQLGKQAAAEWSRFTIMAEGEFFAGLTEIVRIRFPYFSIWNLPVAAHEFGHYLQRHRRIAKPYGELRQQIVAAAVEPYRREEQAEQARKTRRHVDEYFADLFAMHSLGPAWASTCILLRFSPRRAYVESPSHPSDDRRAHLVLAGLKRTKAFRAIAKNLGSIWREGVVAAGNDNPDHTQLEGKDWMLQWLEPMLDLMPPEVGYSEWWKPYQLSQDLLQTDWQEKAHGLELRDVLNGAWLCRLESDGANLDLMAERALTLSQGIVHPEDGKQPHR